MSKTGEKSCNFPELFFRGLFIMVVPLLFAQTFIYSPLSSGFCFSSPTSTFLGTDGSPSIGTLEQEVSSSLDQSGSNIQSFGPILPLNQSWLRFDVVLQNDLKVAIVVTEPKSYNEATTTFYIQTQYGTSTIPYTQTVEIAHGIESDQFSNLISAWGFQSNHSPVVVGPHQWVSMQTNPNLGEICVGITLEGKYRFLIYLECLVVFVGLLVLFKEAARLVMRGFYNYFVKDSD